MIPKPNIIPLLVFILFSTFVFEIHAADKQRGRACHVIEGMSLPGCTPQAQPLECGPEKLCPPCGTGKNPRTRIRGSSTSGECGEWEQQCSGPPENRVCQQVCKEWLPPSCSNVTESCVDAIGPDVPGTGTYSCSMANCGCSPPPPDHVICQTRDVNGNVYNGSCVLCTADTPCPTGGN